MGAPVCFLSGLFSGRQRVLPLDQRALAGLVVRHSKTLHVPFLVDSSSNAHTNRNALRHTNQFFQNFEKNSVDAEDLPEK